MLIHSLPRTGLSHRGHVSACGLLLFVAELEPHECVRVLAPLLSSGDLVLRVHELLFVRFARPRSLRAEHAPASVVVEQHCFLSAFPLTAAAPAEARQLSAPPGSLLWLRGGRVSLATPLELAPCAPEDGLELGAVERVEVESLGAAPRALALVSQAEAASVRETLGIPQLSSEALRAHDAAARQAAWRQRASVLLRHALSWLRTRRGAREGDAGGGGSSGGRAARDSAAASWLIAAALKAASRLGLLWLWLMPHERYLQKLDALFARGDTLEALRNALPLSGEGNAGPRRLALTPPGRRSELRLTNGAGPSSVLPIDDNWHNHLRRLYERAFQQLEHEGQIEHAAFVLAELLADVPRAIQWLERHHKLRLAAELADAREAPVGERVRLWFQAKEPRRAVDLAVRHGAFADAVKRLEQSDPALARQLRMRWAEHSASAGQYLEAARIAWSVPEAERLVARWLEIACEEQGPSAHSAWVLRLARDPTLSHAAQAVLAPVMVAEHGDAAMQRTLLAQELLWQPQNQALDALTTPLLRGLSRDRLANESTLANALFGELLARAPALRVDLPPAFEQARPASHYTRSLCTLQLLAHDRGTMSVHDAVPLPGGRTLLALGELGVMLLSRSGTLLVHWKREPAYRLVPSDGAHVITLAGRGPLKRLGRLDLAMRRHTRWFDLELSSHADRFDGMSWYVTLGSQPARLACLDAVDETPRALWQVELGHSSSAVTLSPTSCDVVALGPGTPPELWSYERPSNTLRSRIAIDLTGVTLSVLAGEARWVALRSDSPETLQLWQADTLLWTRELPATLERFDASPTLGLHWPWLWLVQHGDHGARVDILDADTGVHLQTVHLARTTQPSVRIFDGVAVIADQLGRVLRIDLRRGSHTLLRV